MNDPYIKDLMRSALDLEAQNKELTKRMTHQAGHLIELLTEIAKLKDDVAWWQEVCKTKDEQIYELSNPDYDR